MKDKLNQLAIPLMLNNVLGLLIGLCDQAMIGHVSITGFAAVGIVAGIINSLSGVLGSISITFNILGARAKGVEDDELLESYYQIHLIQSLMIGLIFTSFVFLFGRPILQIVYQLEGKVLDEAMSYAFIFSMTLGLNLLLFTGSAYFKIMNQTKYILIGNLTAAILNVIFDYILIFGLFGLKPLGIIGNAMGSVLALLVNLCIYFFVLKMRIRKKPKALNLEHLKCSLKLSMPLMIQEFLESTVIVLIIGALVARIGLLEVAVYQLLTMIIEITLMPTYAYGQGVLTLIGEGIENSSKILYQGIIRALLFYFIFATCFMINRESLLGFITNQSVMIETASSYLPFVYLISVLFIPMTLYKFKLQAIGSTKRVIADTLISYSIGLLVAFLLGLITQRLLSIYIGLGSAYCICLFLFRSHSFKV